MLSWRCTSPKRVPNYWGFYSIIRESLIRVCASLGVPLRMSSSSPSAWWYLVKLLLGEHFHQGLLQSKGKVSSPGAGIPALVLPGYTGRALDDLPEIKLNSQLPNLRFRS